MARRLKGNILAIRVNTKELSRAARELKILISKATPRISLDVAKRVYKDINASGNVPFDTGYLMSNTNVFKDRFEYGFATMGWFAPYAKKMYYGVHGDKVWKTVNGQKMSFASSSTGNGIPFWDTPFTKNPQYMLKIYEWAFNKGGLGKYRESGLGK